MWIVAKVFGECFLFCCRCKLLEFRSIVLDRKSILKLRHNVCLCVPMSNFAQHKYFIQKSIHGKCKICFCMTARKSRTNQRRLLMLPNTNSRSKEKFLILCDFQFNFPFYETKTNEKQNWRNARKRIEQTESLKFGANIFVCFLLSRLSFRSIIRSHESIAYEAIFRLTQNEFCFSRTSLVIWLKWMANSVVGEHQIDEKNQ